MNSLVRKAGFAVAFTIAFGLSSAAPIANAVEQQTNASDPGYLRLWTGPNNTGREYDKPVALGGCENLPNDFYSGYNNSLQAQFVFSEYNCDGTKKELRKDWRFSNFRIRSIAHT